MRRKQLIWSFMLILLFVFGSLLSQTTDSVLSLPKLKRWSLNFHMNEKFNWTKSNGNLISGQYFIKKNVALRLGINSSYSFTTLEENRCSAYGKPTNDLISVDLYPTILFYSNTNPFRFCWGLGSVLGFLQSEDKTEQRLENGEWQTMSKKEITGYNLGLQGVMGAEWRFRDFLFLFLEYNPLLVYRYRENDDMRTGETQIKTLRFYTNPIGLGIGILF